MFLDKCELVQALREHRLEITQLASEQRSYVEFVRQLSTEWQGNLDVACSHIVASPNARPDGPLDYVDSETLFAFDCSVDVCHDEVYCWQ